MKSRSLFKVLHPAFHCVDNSEYVGSTFYKYRGDVVVTHYYIVKNDC